MKKEKTITITENESRYYHINTALLSYIIGVEELTEEVNATLPNLISEDLGNRITGLQEGIRDRISLLDLDKGRVDEEYYLIISKRYDKLKIDVDRLLNKVKDNLEEGVELEES